LPESVGSRGDGDGTIIKANATFLTWTGYHRQKLVGSRRFQDLLATGDRIFYETHAAPMLFMQGMRTR
jgi:serine/threonine-protein kinase RsbW